MSITIEKNVPIQGTRGRGENIYPWADMQVGDSFLFPEGYKPNSAYQLARHQSRNGYQFKVKQIDGRVRCWRVA